jgi:hypothetical protein
MAENMRAPLGLADTLTLLEAPPAEEAPPTEEPVLVAPVVVFAGAAPVLVDVRALPAALAAVLVDVLDPPHAASPSAIAATARTERLSRFM